MASWLGDDGNKPTYYIFNLDQYPRLGLHKPYYQIIGDTMSAIMDMNVSYHEGNDDHLKNEITDVLARTSYDPIYLEDHPNVRAEMERLIFKFLKHIHREYDPVVIRSDVHVVNNMLIVGASLWF